MVKMSQKVKSVKRYLLSRNMLFFVFAVLALPILPLATYIIVTLLLANLFPAKLSLLKRLVFAVLILWLAHSLIYIPLSYLEIVASAQQVLFFEAALLFCLYLAVRVPFNYQLNLTRADLVSLAIACVAFLFMFLPFVRISPGFIVNALSAGEDNASHMGLYNYHLKHHRYSYGRPDDGLVSGLESYQQGFHLNLAFLTDIKPGNVDPVIPPIRFYYFLLSLGYAFFILTIALVAYENLKRLTTKTFLLVTAASLPIFTYCAVMGPLLLLFTWGFQTQIFALAILVALLLLQANKHAFRSSFLYLLTALSLIALISHSWYFLTPIALLAFALSEWRGYRKLLRLTPLRLGMLALLAAAIFFPTIISFMAGASVSSVTAPGGVAKLSKYWLLTFAALVPGFLCIKLLKLHKPQNPYPRPLFFMTVAAFCFAALVGAYQLKEAGVLSYYFYKTIYIFVIPVLVLGLYLFAAFFSWLHAKIKTLHVLLTVAAVLFVASCLLIIVLKPAHPRAYWGRGLHTYSDPIQIDKIIKIHNKGEDWVFMGGCNNVYEYINNRWTGALFLTETTKRYWLSDATLRPGGDDTKQLLEYIQEPPIDKKINIMYQSKCTDQAAMYALRDENVKIILLD